MSDTPRYEEIHPGDPDDVFDPRLFKCLECRPQIVITKPSGA